MLPPSSLLVETSRTVEIFVRRGGQSRNTNCADSAANASGLALQQRVTWWRLGAKWQSRTQESQSHLQISCSPLSWCNGPQVGKTQNFDTADPSLTFMSSAFSFLPNSFIPFFLLLRPSPPGWPFLAFYLHKYTENENEQLFLTQEYKILTFVSNLIHELWRISSPPRTRKLAALHPQRSMPTDFIFIL